MKMASLVALIPHIFILIPTAIAVLTVAGKAGIANPGPHGFSEILYAFSSAAGITVVLLPACQQTHSFTTRF